MQLDWFICCEERGNFNRRNLLEDFPQVRFCESVCIWFGELIAFLEFLIILILIDCVGNRHAGNATGETVWRWNSFRGKLYIRRHYIGFRKQPLKNLKCADLFFSAMKVHGENTLVVSNFVKHGAAEQSGVLRVGDILKFVSRLV